MVLIGLGRILLPRPDLYYAILKMAQFLATCEYYVKSRSVG
jgi:hypothetical protein